MKKTIIASLAVLILCSILFLMNNGFQYQSKEVEIAMKNEATLEAKAHEGDLVSARLLLEAYLQLDENDKGERLSRSLIGNKFYANESYLFKYYLASFIDIDCENSSRSFFRQNCPISRINESKALYSDYKHEYENRKK